MKPYYQTELGAIYHGDCLQVMHDMKSETIDSIVTDPPYALKFMGKGWDKVLPPMETWKECLRVAKPGAMLLAFGGTRTYHRLTCAIEDAGWEIRDCIMWVYGSGFPKSLDISKAIDKATGAERELLGPTIHHSPGRKATNTLRSMRALYRGEDDGKYITAPATDEAKQWNGYGTALKPAYEPIVVAMKPLDGTFAGNALKWGVAGLNVDGCRLSGKDTTTRHSSSSSYMTRKIGEIQPKQDTYPTGSDQGRFPANLIHDGSEECVRLFPVTKQQDKRRRKLAKMPPGMHGIYGSFSGTDSTPTYGDNGTAARFFYCAKASRSERDAGLEGAKYKHGGCFNGNNDMKNNCKIGRNPEVEVLPVKNNHPTVKPLKLMEYLVKLVSTPTGGMLMDLFGGSGTTGLAAEKLGIKWTLIDNVRDYCDISANRISKGKAESGKGQAGNSPTTNNTNNTNGE
jgi:DNA modification methylase